MIPAATETFNDSTPGSIAMRTAPSHRSRASRRTPFPSLPRTIAVRRAGRNPAISSPSPAVAAYNAGPGGVRRHIDLARTDLDRFVEELPYAETRVYVQRVLQSYGIYRWLYR